MSATPATLTAWTLTAGIERELVAAQAATGESVHFASRPLNEDEKRSGVRFATLAAIVDSNTGSGSRTLQSLYDGARAALLVELFGVEEGIEDETIEVAVMVALLGQITYNPPERYKKAREAAAPKLRATVEDSYRGGVLTVHDEARRQGKNTEGWTRPEPPVEVGNMAEDVADHPWTRTAERVINEYKTPRRALAVTTSREELEGFIADTSQKGTTDLFNQANQAALGAGRMDAAEASGEFLTAVASEIMDGATCAPCARIDGTRFPTLEAAKAAYPSGYVNCLGRARCRGVCVYLFDAPDPDGG